MVAKRQTGWRRDDEYIAALLAMKAYMRKHRLRYVTEASLHRAMSVNTCERAREIAGRAVGTGHLQFGSAINGRDTFLFTDEGFSTFDSIHVARTEEQMRQKKQEKRQREEERKAALQS